MPQITIRLPSAKAIALAVLVSVTLALLGGQHALGLVGRFLVREDALVRSDAIVVTAAGLPDRILEAVDLYKAGYADRMIWCREPLPETLIESELFGHEKGAFTGALQRRSGCFELADRGTLLLDEIGDMPVGTQAKLLRVLEDSKVRRLGGSHEFNVDVRVIASTNKDLRAAIQQNLMREDLYYRLNVFHIRLPALRERPEDIPPLTAALLRDLNKKHECRVVGLHRDVAENFQRYRWPGNVRELRNVLERAVILAGEGTVQASHLMGSLSEDAAGVSPRRAADPNEVTLRVGTTVREAEKALLLRTLDHTGNNKTRAARILDISLKTLHNKLKEYQAQ